MRALALSVPLALVLALPAPAAALEQKLIGADGAADDQLGTSVAIDGDTAVVGAPNADIGANQNQGAVYVFRRAGDRWVQTAKLTASDGTAIDRLGTSVAIDGDTIVAGAPYDGGAAGAAYTFARTGPAARTQTAKLTASDGAVNDLLGFSVAIDGDTIVAGALGDDGFAGSAYTFARTGLPARNQTARLTATDRAANDELGSSVAIDGDTIVVGASGDDGGAGAAYTFARTGAAAWIQTARLTATDRAANDELGSSVAIDGNTIVAGAPVDDGFAGSAYTFARTGLPARNQTAKLTATDRAANDVLGDSVAIDGNTIVAGAFRDDDGAGAAYTFARTGAAAWIQTARLTASDRAADDELGSSVAIDGGAIIAGAPYDDVGARTDQGSASIFFVPAPRAAPRMPSAPALLPGACANTKRGTNRSDRLIGTAAGDRLVGLGGNDRLFGRRGDDCLSGGRGSDRLSGGPGRDRLTGGPGNDRLTGGRGRNRYAAGTGKDTVNARNRRRERIDCGPGRDRASVDRIDRVRHCERVKRR